MNISLDNTPVLLVWVLCLWEARANTPSIRLLLVGCVYFIVTELNVSYFVFCYGRVESRCIFVCATNFKGRHTNLGLRILLINANSVTLRLVLLIRVIFEAISTYFHWYTGWYFVPCREPYRFCLAEAQARADWWNSVIHMPTNCAVQQTKCTAYVWFPSSVVCHVSSQVCISTTVLLRAEFFLYPLKYNVGSLGSSVQFSWCGEV